MNSVKKYILLILLSAMTFLTFAQESEITTITILRARQTAYKKSEETGNDTIELEGSVVLSVQKGSTVTEIDADKITYDRKTEMLYAEGNVEISTKSSSSGGGETTTANTLLMNTSTLEGIFDGGRVVQTKSDALNLPAGSTLIVFSELFGKSSDNVIAFKNSSLTFCDAEVPHWHIDATRTWLLPGGEFAFFNALLYVGVIPVLYFPAFYYPKDELIFNPVFSFKKREGTSIQTTTYLWGRKPLAPSSSTSSSSSSSDESTDSSTSESLKALYNFVKPATLKEQKLEGIVLHNLDEDYTGDTTQYVKFLADWYSNLGFFTGVDSYFQPKNSYVSKIETNFNLGFSKTIFKRDGEYYPFTKNGMTFNDSSNFLGFFAPFRYSGKIDFTLSKPFTLSLSLPFYSDPYYSYDFLLNRAETMDWISYFLDRQTENTTTSQSEISTFNWQLSSSYSPKIPSVLTPYISSASFRLNSSVNFSSKNVEDRKIEIIDNDGKKYTAYEKTLFQKNSKGITLEETEQNTVDYNEWRGETPNKRFYYPSSITPATIDFSLSGTLFSWPLPKKQTTKTTPPTYTITLNKPDELKTEKQLQQEQEKALAEEKTKEESKNGGEEGEKIVEQGEKSTLETEIKDENLFTYNIPDLAYTSSLLQVSPGVTYKLSYNVGANLTTQLSYASKQIYTAEDFDWNNIRSYMYTFKVPASLSSNLNFGNSIFTLRNSLSFSPVFQDHPYLLDDESKGGYKESEMKTLIEADYNAQNRDLINSNTVTLKPLTYVEMFSDSNVSWSSAYKFYRRKFIGTADEPEWEVLDFDWDDENCVTTNSLSATVSSKQLNNLLKQNLTLQFIMPPLLRQFNTTLGLSFPYVTTSISTGFKETTKDDVPEEDKWAKSPLNQSLSVNLFDSKLTLSESYTFNLEDEHNENLKLSASCFGLQVSYSMAYTIGYNFDKTSGWSAKVDKEFLPYSVNFSYSMPSKTYYKWFNRITFAPGLSTNLTADLLRPTNSSFVFSPSIKFKITDFFDITFSSTSKNSILYWYFHEGLYDEGIFGWEGFPFNMIQDLVDSFRFDQKSKREGSGFKLNSLNMSIAHELHDWRFSMTAKIEPRLLNEGGKKYYDFNPYITIGVVWNPMESIKTSIVDDYGEWKLE